MVKQQLHSSIFRTINKQLQR